MKHLKHVLATVVTLFMAFALAVPAFAADGDGYTISVPSTDTHTYRVYQVLTGTLSEQGSKELGDPEWGADAIGTGSVNDFIASITAEGLSEQDIAQLVAAQLKSDATGRGTVSAGEGNSLTVDKQGYYIMVDVTQLQEYGNNPKKIDTLALNVVKVVNNVEVTKKWGTTEDKKTIESDTLGDATEENPNTEGLPGSTDNVSVGDTVNFKIEATVPENADLYNYFYFVINDTLSEGLTLNADSIKVYKDSVSDANKLALTTDYLLKTDATIAPKDFEVGLVDAKSLHGKKIIVTYSAVLNENAKIGDEANTNTSTVTFSNDPNHDYNGDPENPKPGFPDQTDLTATGETPQSVTETYTTGIEIQKVDQDGNVLTGAEFTLTGTSAEIVLVSSETFTEVTEEGAAFEYYGLTNGTYTKEPPVTADYMKQAEAGATKGYVVAESTYDGDDTVTVGGTIYRPYKTGDTGTVYILVKANADQYDGKHYNKTVTYTQKDTTGEGAVTATAYVGADGVVRFQGLGEGTYTITETVTPAGYNTVAPITVTINFTANPAEGGDHWTKDSTGATYDAADGVFKIEVENNKGTELPETGGMGTTILYIVGGCMVAAGVVMFLAKRRMANAAE